MINFFEMPPYAFPIKRPRSAVHCDELAAIHQRALFAEVERTLNITTKEITMTNELPDAALTAIASSYNKKHEFKPGDVVRQKDGLRDHLGDKFVVIEVLKEPVYDTTNYSANHESWREPLDIRLGRYLEGSLQIKYYDSHRFEPSQK